MKGVIAAVISVALFRNAVTAKGMLGYAITVAGVFLYSACKRRQRVLKLAEAAKELESVVPLIKVGGSGGGAVSGGGSGGGAAANGEDRATSSGGMLPTSTQQQLQQHRGGRSGGGAGAGGTGREVAVVSPLQGGTLSPRIRV